MSASKKTPPDDPQPQDLDGPAEAPAPAEALAEAASPVAEPSSPDPEMTELVRQRDEYLDQLQRSRAEFANYQKRARAQADIDRAYAVGDLATDLLSVLDNFERAVEAARSAGAESIVEGLDLVHRHFLDTLAKHGVELIEARGQPFDPAYHEAIAQKPDPSQPEGTVVEEASRGYKLRDRVLRPTKAVVSTRSGA